eukprot:12543569-Alexandrium_andersonii.AAC.1
MLLYTAKSPKCNPQSAQSPSLLQTASFRSPPCRTCCRTCAFGSRDRSVNCAAPKRPHYWSRKVRRASPESADASGD